MRTAIWALITLSMVGGVALAQPNVALPPAAATPAKLDIDTPILVLMDDPRTLAVLDRRFPGMSERMRDPEVANIFANTSLNDMSKDADHGRALTPVVLARVAAELEVAQAAPKP